MNLTIRLLPCALLCLPAAPALAQVRCEPALLGGLEADPLVVSGSFAFPDGCTLDLGDREVIIEGTLRGLDLTILAGDLTIAPRGRIEGGSGTTTIVLRQSRGHAGALLVDGALVSNGSHGGGVEIVADGEVRVSASGRVEATASDAAGSGGLIAVTAGGSIALAAGSELAAAGGSLAALPASVELRSSAGAIAVERAVRVSGGWLGGRGTISMSAALQVTITSQLLATGGCEGDACQPGGKIELAAGGDLTVKGVLDASGAEASPLASEASGGVVTLDADGSIDLAAESVRLRGGAAGSGGLLRARCGGDYSQSSSLDASGSAETSNGGDVEIVCGGSAVLRGATAVSGGIAGLGGTFRLEAGGDVALAGDVDIAGNYPAGGVEIAALGGSVRLLGLIDARGDGDFGTGAPVSCHANLEIDADRAAILAHGAGPQGLGGAIVLDSLQAVSIGSASRLDASGDGQEGSLGEGGTITARACQVTVSAGASLRAAGAAGGTISLTASDGLGIHGSLDAESDGLIELRSAPGLVPELTGSSLSPRPLLVDADNVEACIVLPPCAPARDLRCVAGDARVALTWSRSPGHTQTQVLRDGILLAVLPAGAGSYVDEEPADGLSTYSVTGSCSTASATAVRCTVQFPGGPSFRRGDCNVSFETDISDAITILNYLFQGLPVTLPCQDACDFNDDGSTDISDAIMLLTFLFIDATRPLPPPTDACGADPSADSLLCESFNACP